MNVSGREHQAPAPAGLAARTSAGPLALRAGLVVLTAAVLFFCYWRQSQIAPVSSDGSANILQAWDMLHGNVLLHDWHVSDVSFYTTELPQYALIEALFGLGPWVVHVAAAMTYTLLVLLAAFLAKGDARGAAGTARALLAAGLMLAPQLSATQIVLLSPNHTGTAVPLLVTWLLIDRASPARGVRGARGGRGGGQPPREQGGSGGDRPPGPARYVPVLVCLLFTWTMVADFVVLLTGIVPLVLVAVARACPGLLRRGKRPGSRGYELALAGAAAVAGLAGLVAPKVMAAVGGYHQAHVGTAVDLAQLQHGAWVTLQAFLELFGANLAGASFYGASPVLEVVFVALHLAGAALVAWALGLAFLRFFRSAELIVPAFAVAIVLNLGAYMISTHAQDLLGAREMAAVLPLGAVLAGRVFGDRIPAWIGAAKRWFVPLLAVLTAGYLASLGYGAAQAPAPVINEPLATWLAAHRLTDGLAGYWQANSTTVDSGRRLLLSAVVQNPGDRLVPYEWETDDANYDPARHFANFVVADGPFPLRGMQISAELTFGRPQQIYRADGYTIMVWNTNLLARLPGRA